MGPTNSDIKALLGKMNTKLNQLDEKHYTLYCLEKKVDGFDKEVK